MENQGADDADATPMNADQQSKSASISAHQRAPYRPTGWELRLDRHRGGKASPHWAAAYAVAQIGYAR